MLWNSQRFPLFTATLSTFLALSSVAPERTMAVTITANVTGSSTPPTAVFPESVTNGDFLLNGNHISTLVGDGIDDVTTWNFDFTKDPNFRSFSLMESLTSAPLTLTLAPKDGLIVTDAVRVGDLPLITTPIQILSVGETATITLNLLDYYSSSQILGAFTSAESGKLPMVYVDDAVVSFAKLELTDSSPTSVPEPTSALSSLLFGVLGSTSILSKRRLN
jgi:hypothetical protein